MVRFRRRREGLVIKPKPLVLLPENTREKR